MELGKGVLEKNGSETCPQHHGSKPDCTTNLQTTAASALETKWNTGKLLPPATSLNSYVTLSRCKSGPDRNS
jgi:hypothetical protein